MNNETETFDNEFNARIKQQESRKECQAAKVNPSNREKAIIDAGNDLAIRLYAYATTQKEVDLVKAWHKAVNNG